MKLASDSCFLKYLDLHRTSAHKKNCSTFMRQNGYLFMTLIVIAPWLCWLDPGAETQHLDIMMREEYYCRDYQLFM